MREVAEIYAKEVNRVTSELGLVISHFAKSKPACFIRLGDGELFILRRGDFLSDLLMKAIEGCTILGLPDSFSGNPHPWRSDLLGMIRAPKVPVVSAVLPLVAPSLISTIVNNKRAVWITHQADRITSRLREPAFCDFYGFGKNRDDVHICTPAGRTLPYVKPDEYRGLLDEICERAASLSFDIAIIGMGAMGKMVAHRLHKQGRQCFDAGCMLSAMRGVVDREVFKHEMKALVWTGEAKPPVAKSARRVMLVLRSGGEYRASHVLRLAAQLPGCEISVLTDLPANALPGVKVLPLQHDWPGWWAKMEMFRPDIGGTFLYLDLDTAVLDLPPEFFSHPTSLALGVFTEWEKKNGYVMNGKHGYLQSGMMLLHEVDRAAVWRHWSADPVRHMRAHRGDQDFLHAAGLAASSWQDAFPRQICSYKLNWLPRVDENGDELDPKKMRVVCFHGEPRPWNVGGPFPGPISRPANAVIVGNGPSALKQEMGARIDSFADVVRINSARVAGFEKHVGTRTTTWSTVGGYQPPEYGGVLPDRALCIVGDGGEFKRRPETIYRINAHHYNLVRKLVQARSRRADVSGIIPSSGFLIAWWYLEVLQMPRIAIYGFDHFSKKETGVHHYFEKSDSTAPVEHDGEAEAEIIEEFVAAGRIERLTA